MNAVVSNEAELYVAPGGALFRFMQRIAPGVGGWSVGRRILVLLLVTWVPMCLFAVVQGTAVGATPRASFLYDLATHARFFIGIPMLIYADHYIGARLRRAGLQFLHDGIVVAEDHAAFERAIASLARRRESTMAVVIIAGLALFGAWNLTYESAKGVGRLGWQALELADGSASYAALWNHLVAVPVLLFLWYRWLWRIAIWTLFLRDVARLRLQLVPTHADAGGGLSFLGVAHTAFGILAFAIGSVLSAQAAFQVLHEGASLQVFQTPAIIALLVVEVLFLGPLLVFTPLMLRVRRAALESYGSLVVQYNRSFGEKWIDGTPPDEPLLGSGDIQSLADLGTGFGFVKAMRFVPFDRGVVIRLALATLLPGLPLLLLVVPLEEILDAAAKLVI